jgi:Flp pilus assembly protein TadB
VIAALIAVNAWSAAVLLAGRLLRRPRRVVRLVASSPSRARRRGRRVVALVAVTVLATVAHPILGLAALCLLIVRRRWRRVRVARLEAARKAVALPDLVELIAAGIAAGCSARHAFLSSVEIAPASLRPACERLRQRLLRGERFSDALQHLARDVGETACPMVTALCAHERDGVPLQPTLERIAADARRQRRQQAEAAIRRLPVQLSVPLVTCTLSAFAVLTVVPLGAATLRSLQGHLPSSPTPTGGSP